MEWNRVMVVDALSGVQGLPERSVQCVVMSPPYFRQRDYGVPGQWGRESDPEAFIAHLVELFRALRRVLTDTGTVWLVLGDSYAGRGYGLDTGMKDSPYTGVKRKDLLGIPWMTALALRNDGWYLRQDVVWFKVNAMPESVTDRCTRSHEYVFMFSKNARYYYNHLAIATPLSESAIRRLNQGIAGQRGSSRVYGKKNGPMKAAFTSAKKGDGHGRRYEGMNGRFDQSEIKVANRKSVWPMATAMSKEQHFASYPAAIPNLCIRASTREGDVVLDPFTGTGTTLMQASVLACRYIGFDLNPKYVGIARRRLRKLEGLFFRG